MIIDCKQGDASWHALRTRSLGATSASVLAECNPYKTKLDLYNEMVLGVETPFNDAMKRGVELEPKALVWVEKKLGVSLSNVTMNHPTIEHMHASFDGISFDGKTAVEIKCPGEKTHDMAVKGKIPEMYIYQMQWQMMVAGLEKMWYCSYRDDSDVAFIQCNRNQEIIKDLEIRHEVFWTNHISPKIPPEIERKPIPVKTERVDISEEDSSRKLRLEINFRNRKELKEKVKYLEGLIECLDEVIISDCQGESIELGEFKCTKSIVRGNVDYSRIDVLKGINLDDYRKESREQWRIS